MRQDRFATTKRPCSIEPLEHHRARLGIVLQEQDRTVTGSGPQSQRLTHRFVVDRLELEHRLAAVGTPDRG